MRIIDASNRAALTRLLSRRTDSDRAFARRVRGIVDRVRTSGDRALVRFAKRFDGVKPPLEVTRDEMNAAAQQVDPDVRRALRQAAQNIARVAFRQIPKHWDLEVTSGVRIHP